MKNALLPLLLLASAIAFAEVEKRSVEVPVGGNESVEIGFLPSGYRHHSGEGLVSVRLVEGSSSALLIASGGEGRALVEFPAAEQPGRSLLLTVEVVGDLEETARDLRRQLRNFGGLTVTKGRSKVLVDGRVSSPGDLAKLRKILALSDFRGKVEETVTFGPDRATFDALRKELEDAGFALAPAGESPGEGRIAVAESSGRVVVSGHVWSAADLERLRALLAAQTWLSLDGAAAEDRVPATVSVSADDSLLELSVAFVAVSRNKLHEMGSDSGVQLSGVWSGFYDFLTGKHRSADALRIDGSLATTLSMFAQSGIGREVQKGTIRFHANEKPGQSLHIGGTTQVTPEASGDGDAPQPQTFDYGFKVENLGSHRINGSWGEANIRMELNGMPKIGGKRRTEISQEKRAETAVVRLPLGTTVPVGGRELFREITTEPSGTPLLRHIPILNWFVSKEGEESVEDDILILVSLRKVGEDEAPSVPNTPLKDITFDASRPNADRLAEEREQERSKGGHGCLFDWFRW